MIDSNRRKTMSIVRPKAMWRVTSRRPRGAAELDPAPTTRQRQIKNGVERHRAGAHGEADKPERAEAYVQGAQSPTKPQRSQNPNNSPASIFDCSPAPSGAIVAKLHIAKLPHPTVP